MKSNTSIQIVYRKYTVTPFSLFPYMSREISTFCGAVIGKREICLQERLKLKEYVCIVKKGDALCDKLCMRHQSPGVTMIFCMTNCMLIGMSPTIQCPW